jgi:ubiquinone/menaquinone biosynthesis C-methylase UbiE
MVKPYLGKAASTYEAKRKRHAIWLKEDAVLLQILKGYKPKPKLLDMPVGTGRFLDFYNELGIAAVGIDLSPDMLKIARTRFPDAELRIGDIRRIPLADKSVDVSVCIRLLYFLNRNEVRIALSELARVSKKAIVFSARFAHRNGPRAKKVIAHDWNKFQELVPFKWQIIRKHSINDLLSDEYMICEMEPVK